MKFQKGHKAIGGFETRFKKYQIPWNKGKKHSEETKQKIREKAIGRKLSEEVKEKIGKAGKGRKHSEIAKKKIGLANKGMNNGQWKGGIVKSSNGYIFRYKPEHPLANNHGQVLEHRLVIEEVIGRYLKPEEVIHHINGIRNDNRIENLMLFKNQAEHMKYH
jgi:hypothetical protein